MGGGGNRRSGEGGEVRPKIVHSPGWEVMMHSIVLLGRGLGMS
jgi:hypothetical protein